MAALLLHNALVMLISQAQSHTKKPGFLKSIFPGDSFSIQAILTVLFFLIEFFRCKRQSDLSTFSLYFWRRRRRRKKEEEEEQEKKSKTTTMWRFIFEFGHSGRHLDMVSWLMPLTLMAIIWNSSVLTSRDSALWTISTLIETHQVQANNRKCYAPIKVKAQTKQHNIKKTETTPPYGKCLFIKLNKLYQF